MNTPVVLERFPLCADMGLDAPPPPPSGPVRPLSCLPPVKQCSQCLKSVVLASLGAPLLVFHSDGVPDTTQPVASVGNYISLQPWAEETLRWCFRTLVLDPLESIGPRVRTDGSRGSSCHGSNVDLWSNISGSCPQGTNRSVKRFPAGLGFAAN